MESGGNRERRRGEEEREGREREKKKEKRKTKNENHIFALSFSPILRSSSHFGENNVR